MANLRLRPWQKTAPWLTPDAALAELVQLRLDLSGEKDVRRRAKTARRLAFVGTSLALVAASLDCAAIEAGIEGLRQARRAGAVTDDLNRAEACLVKFRLELLGAAAPEVCAKAAKRVAVDSGALVATATALDRQFLLCSVAERLAAMNAGRYFLIGLGSDGKYGVQLRLVDGREPVLAASEYRRVQEATEPGFLCADQPRLYFGAAENVAKGAAVDIAPGLYKVAAFLMRASRGQVITLVACRSSEPPAPLSREPALNG